ncbi:MAG: UDP-N-acetylmuramoyl-L-alanyl-D-glutamate--2,6-diaminopimelate ligase [Alphaproteobacteria bacterium]|nr:UDP-N-acetylmuramoyl-L-alanyl-D-glutamate--2,6-diaminopimelate ligase [Alphaproteobacteria bacterium]
MSVISGAPGKVDPEIVGLTADSRAVRPGFLFAALPGVEANGADFIPQAEENGAAAVLGAPGVCARVPVIEDANPRRRLALIAAKFFGAQPNVVVGVTGTNGKTSTARFAAQLWRLLGDNAGSLGTLGAEGPGYFAKLRHTTPDPVILHEILAGMANSGTTHLAMEVSSHGLAQYRVDGVEFAAAAFTNITQDHLDYHADFEAYFAAKLRLFSELLPQGCLAVVNADGEGADRVIETARRAGARVLTTGAAGREIKLLDVSPQAAGLAIKVAAGGRNYDISLPLIGAFQAENALLAAGLTIGLGAQPSRALPLLARLEGAPGRMQRVAEAGGGTVYVDYAHTPDAVATALAAIRPHVSGKLIAIIGAGGDRDREKRPLMGAAAQTGADIVIVTDDNPRSEDPAAIRRAVLSGAPGALEIGDRGAAIEEGVRMLGAGDVLLIAGKGHETGQIIGERVTPFDDAAVARAAAGRRR